MGLLPSLNMPFQPSGTLSVVVNLALISGWLKHGKADGA